MKTKTPGENIYILPEVSFIRKIFIAEKGSYKTLIFI